MRHSSSGASRMAGSCARSPMRTAPLAESINPRLNYVAVTPDGRRIMSVGQTTKRREETKLRDSHTNVMMSEVRFWDIENGERIADYHGDDDYGFGYGALSREAGA